MGKKGKMSSYDGSGEHGKWAKNAPLRNIESSLSYARQTAYDHALIERKAMDSSRLSRKKLVFPHLSSLLSQRVREDMREAVNPVVYDHSWQQHFSSLYHYDKYKEVVTNMIGAQRKSFMASLVVREERGTVKSLTDICVGTIAKYANLYDAEDVAFALSTSAPEKTELFSILSSVYKTVRDDNIQMIARDCLSRLFISPKVSEEGVSIVLQRLQQSNSSALSTLDSWEDIDLSTINISSAIHLKEFTFLGSSISTDSLQQVDEYCSDLRVLSLFNVPFDSERKIMDPTVLCLNVLNAVSEGYCNLETLELQYCPWVVLSALELWCQSLAADRANTQPGHKRMLAKLQRVVITGFRLQSALQRDHASVIIVQAPSSSPAALRSAIHAHFESIIHRLTDHFRLYCKIELIIS